MQTYSDPSRASDPHALPDVEVFHVDLMLASLELATRGPDEVRMDVAGWYWWTCLPGCLPDSDPFGPFATEAEAIADAQDID